MTPTNVEAIAAADRKIVTFILGKQVFGIDMKALIEIREWEEPTPLPSVPHFIRGVTNLRGTVVPVVGLSERLGWEPSVLHSRSCILVVNISGKRAGFLVDHVADIIPISDSDIQPAPDVEVGEQGIISGLVQVPNKIQAGDEAATESGTMVLLLDLEALNVTRHLDLAA
ncbi:chemotaxis protein CheW [Allosphingosinicella deserti]|uniref:Chemotaxis protein CheW n=1 Tax=Allosphingosinicella deserti TaxID=2116704 RepID=A0A2P7QGK7_9SPHN|nr:chemotaxis protein CheW [Sphingomonas deserti]PSJ37095.1 chemotaxis protein CheW [Sphingomonas deserti]